MFLWMELMQLTCRFVLIDVIDIYITLPFIMNSNSRKFENFKSFNMLLLIKARYLISIFFLSLGRNDIQTNHKKSNKHNNNND